MKILFPILSLCLLTALAQADVPAPATFALINKCLKSDSPDYLNIEIYGSFPDAGGIGLGQGAVDVTLSSLAVAAEIPFDVGPLKMMTVAGTGVVHPDYSATFSNVIDGKIKLEVSAHAPSVAGNAYTLTLIDGNKVVHFTDCK